MHACMNAYDTAMTTIINRLASWPTSSKSGTLCWKKWNEDKNNFPRKWHHFRKKQL